jgi:spore germination cell wall hydrolase CwlJ-like protein
MRERGIVFAAVAIVAVYAGPDADAASLRDEQQCLALSLYWEARGEGREGMIAVGWTLLKRVQSREFPSTPCGVVRQGGERPPCQFSWWCDGKSDRPRNQDSWEQA